MTFAQFGLTLVGAAMAEVPTGGTVVLRGTITYIMN